MAVDSFQLQIYDVTNIGEYWGTSPDIWKQWGGNFLTFTPDTKRINQSWSWQCGFFIHTCILVYTHDTWKLHVCKFDKCILYADEPHTVFGYSMCSNFGQLNAPHQPGFLNYLISTAVVTKNVKNYYPPLLYPLQKYRWLCGFSLYGFVQICAYSAYACDPHMIWVNCYCWGKSSMVEGWFSKWF